MPIDTLELTGKVLDDLKPGDIVVVAVANPLRLEYAEDMLATMATVLPEGVKCVVTIPGIDVDVIRRAAIGG